MTKLPLTNWAAWAPGLRSRDDWQQHRSADNYLSALKGRESPDVEWVPSRKRRRCSNLTRIALQTGFDCCKHADLDPGAVKTVFATRHGEINLTADMLKTLADDELLSPMSFGNSVQNTPSSYFCMCADNHHPSRTVASSEETFQSGLMDAVSLLDLPPDIPVLYVCVNVSPPVPFNQFDPIEDSSWGVAVLLYPSSASHDVHISLDNSNRDVDDKLPPSIAFLDWFLNQDQEKLTLPGTVPSRTWTCLSSDKPGSSATGG